MRAMMCDNEGCTKTAPVPDGAVAPDGWYYAARLSEAACCRDCADKLAAAEDVASWFRKVELPKPPKIGG